MLRSDLFTVVFVFRGGLQTHTTPKNLEWIISEVKMFKLCHKLRKTRKNQLQYRVLTRFRLSQKFKKNIVYVRFQQRFDFPKFVLTRVLKEIWCGVRIPEIVTIHKIASWIKGLVLGVWCWRRSIVVSICFSFFFHLWNQEFLFILPRMCLWIIY